MSNDMGFLPERVARSRRHGETLSDTGVTFPMYYRDALAELPSARAFRIPGVSRFGEVRDHTVPKWALPWVAVKPTHSPPKPDPFPEPEMVEEDPSPFKGGARRTPPIPNKIFYQLAHQVAWPEDVKLMFRYPIPGSER